MRTIILLFQIVVQKHSRAFALPLSLLSKVTSHPHSVFYFSFPSLSLLYLFWRLYSECYALELVRQFPKCCLQCWPPRLMNLQRQQKSSCMRSLALTGCGLQSHSRLNFSKQAGQSAKIIMRSALILLLRLSPNAILRALFMPCR